MSQDQAAILFAQHEEYERKARTETLAGVRRAYEVVAQEFLEQAMALDADYVRERKAATE